MATRKEYRAKSNNPFNTNQNVCAQQVASVLRVSGSVRYLHTLSDLKRAVRTRFSVRSVKTAAKSTTVGGARKNLATVKNAICFIVHVDGHVLLLKHDGSTIIDTDPRKRDRRQILHVYGVYNK